MSLSVISSYAIFDPTVLNGTASPVLSTARAKSAADSASTIAVADSTSDTLTLGTFFKEVVSVLKSLVSGDLKGLKADVVRLKNEVQTQSAAAYEPPASSPLEKALSKVSDELSSDDTYGAVGTLAGFLVSAGQISGNLVDVIA